MCSGTPSHVNDGPNCRSRQGDQVRPRSPTLHQLRQRLLLRSFPESRSPWRVIAPDLLGRGVWWLTPNLPQISRSHPPSHVYHHPLRVSPRQACPDWRRGELNLPFSFSPLNSPSRLCSASPVISAYVRPLLFPFPSVSPSHGNVTEFVVCARLSVSFVEYRSWVVC